MKTKLTHFTLLFFALIPLQAIAQKNFIEGTIVYKVKIEKPDPKLALQTSNGTLTLMLKGKVVVQTLSLQSGFKNTMIFNGNTKSVHSLRKIGNETYALQLDTNQVNKKYEKCSKLTLQDYESDIKSIGGFKTEKAKLICNNAAPLIVYYTKEWKIENEQLFEDFATFEYLPLSYDIKNDDGTMLHFELQSIEANPIDNNSLKIPDGYKVISYEQYKSWQH